MLILSEALQIQLLAEARAAFPAECCGLLEGSRQGPDVHVTAVHGARNVAAEPQSGFLVDPEAHFRLLRGLRGTDRSVVGCYHSHPNGRPGPSPTDRTGPHEDGFVWVILATGGREGIAAFLAPDFTPLAIKT